MHRGEEGIEVEGGGGMELWGLRERGGGGAREIMGKIQNPVIQEALKLLGEGEIFEKTWEPKELEKFLINLINESAEVSKQQGESPVILSVESLTIRTTKGSDEISIENLSAKTKIGNVSEVGVAFTTDPYKVPQFVEGSVRGKIGKGIFSVKIPEVVVRQNLGDLDGIIKKSLQGLGITLEDWALWVDPKTGNIHLRLGKRQGSASGVQEGGGPSKDDDANLFEERMPPPTGEAEAIIPSIVLKSMSLKPNGPGGELDITAAVMVGIEIKKTIEELGIKWSDWTAAMQVFADTIKGKDLKPQEAEEIMEKIVETSFGKKAVGLLKGLGEQMWGLIGVGDESEDEQVLLMIWGKQ